MVKRAVYTIRDCEGWVRYVGSSGCPEGRYAAHLGSESPIGAFMRNERELSRSTVLKIEEWLPTKEEGFRVEGLYILGYAKLSGDKLLNRARPNGRRLDLLVDTSMLCIRNGCTKKRQSQGQGLCSRHFTEYVRYWGSLAAKHQDEYDRRLIEAGLLLPHVEEVTPESILKELKLEIKNAAQSRSRT